MKRSIEANLPPAGAPLTPLILSSATFVVLAVALSLGFHDPLLWGLAAVGVLPWFRHLLKGEAWAQPVFTLVALALAGLGAWVVKAAPVPAVLLFAAAGAALLDFSQASGVAGDQALPPAPKPRQAWEPWFVAGLLLITVLPRVWHLEAYPRGATGAEGEIAARSFNLIQEGYTAHVGDGDINWPSMAFYQGMIGAAFHQYSVVWMRLPSALWGLLAVLAFYFAARQLASPWAAAAGSLVLSANQLHLTYSREYFPGILLMFTVPAALAFLMHGWTRQKAWAFGLAGLCAGLSLHGYTPGRTVGPLFLAWALWLWATRQARPSLKQQGWFWAGFVLMGSPVMIWALMHPEGYWALVQHVNPSAGKGPLGYLSTAMDQLRPYARFFMVEGDQCFADTIPFAPHLDPFSGALFAVGFFLALGSFWRPLPSLLLGALVTGMLPAMLGGGFSHPTSRRLVLAVPALCFLVVLALEQLRLALASAPAALRRAGLGVLLLGCALVVPWSLHRFFVLQHGDPAIEGNYSVMDWLAAQEMQRHPQAEGVCEQYITQSVIWGIMAPHGQDSRTVYSLEDAIALGRERDHVLLLEPLNRAALPLLKRIYPEVDFKTYPVPGNTRTNFSDPFDTSTYLVSAYVPRTVAAAAQGFVLADGRRWALDQALPAALEGKPLRLRAALVLGLKEESITLGLAWKGWAAKVDGRSAALGKSLPLSRGIHTVELSGVAPAVAGILPLTLSSSGGDPLRDGRLLALAEVPGLSAQYFKGPEPVGKAEFSRLEPLPLRRYHDITELNMPFSARLHALYTPPSSGAYQWKVLPLVQGRVTVAGKRVFDSYPDPKHRGIGMAQPLTATVQLQAGKPVALDVDMAVMDGGANDRAWVLKVLAPGADDFASPDPWSLKPKP